MEFDWAAVQTRKNAQRRRMAALPFQEKLEVLEQLKEATAYIKASSLSRAVEEQKRQRNRAA